jgi:CDGSH-type Zn-finger protein
MPKETSNDRKPVADEMRVAVTKNGPYYVTGGAPLAKQLITPNAEGEPERWTTGERYPDQEEYALCRCGGSEHKPFCDGTHRKNHFDGKETAEHIEYVKEAQVFEGEGLRLTDLPDYCIGARFCHRGGGTWNLTAKSGDPEARQRAIEEAGNCPSGRLVAWDRSTGSALEPTYEKSIGVVEYPQDGVAGPLWVRGGITVDSAEGKAYETRNRTTLCRCGRSSNKPFCDGSHRNPRSSALKQILH